MSEDRIVVEIELGSLVKLDMDLSEARQQVRECVQAARKAAVQWREEVDRVNGALDGLRTALRHALGLDESAWDGDIVVAAQRAWRTAQGLVEGVLVDEGVTELPGAWTQDDGPPSEDYTGDWAADDLVQYDDHGCTFTARLVEPSGGRSWRAMVETFEGRHNHEGVFAIGTEVGVVYGHSVKVWSAEAVSTDAE